MVCLRILFQLLDKVFSELEPFCLAEQDFCVRFFHLVAEHTTIEEKEVLISFVELFIKIKRKKLNKISENNSKP